MKFLSALAIVLLLPAPACAMPASELVARWRAVTKAHSDNGATPAELAASPEARLLMTELAGAVNVYGEQVRAAREMGATPRGCPPKEVDLTIDGVIEEMERLPAGWETREVWDAVAAVMDRLYPCAPASSDAVAAQTAPAPGLPSRDEIRSLRIDFAQGGDWAPLPYEVVKGVILFQATINGRPATVLLDNGAASTLLDAGFARREGIGLGAAVDDGVTAAGTRMTGRTTDSVTLTAPHAFTVSGPLVSTDLDGVSSVIGRRLDAVLGAYMLDNFSVMIQPDKRLLSLVDGGITVGAGAVVPILNGREIEVELDHTPLRLEIDLGYNGVVQLTDAAWRRIFPSGSSQGRMTAAADGVVRAARAGRAELLQVGGISARNVPVTGGYLTDHAVDGIIGYGFLSRGTSVLDPKKKQLTLIPRVLPKQ